MESAKNSGFRSVREHPAPPGALRRRSGDADEHVPDPVREHPAPPGALRLPPRPLTTCWSRNWVREHPAPPGALRPGVHTPRVRRTSRRVREHPAPPGALRQDRPTCRRCGRRGVREHPAPPGALRPRPWRSGRVNCLCQGAPSTIRCIETVLSSPCPADMNNSQGAPSTIRCIETRGGACRGSPR